ESVVEKEQAAEREQVALTKPETMSPTAVLSGMGITVTKDSTAKGKTVWRIKGKTYDVKDILKSELGARWYAPEKSWSIFDESDPSQKIVDALQGRGVSAGSSGANPVVGERPDDDVRARELREREDGRTDERRDGASYASEVSNET